MPGKHTHAFRPRRWPLGVWAVLLATAGSLWMGPALAGETATATGTVYLDADADGQRDPGEPGLPGIRVSNQRDTVLTDTEGRWQLPVDDDTTLFVIKPRDYAVPVDSHGVPRFYYQHKPSGSPESRFPGVPPTGPLPASVDFALMRSEEPERFTVAMVGDTQPRDLREVGYTEGRVMPDLIGSGAAFGVVLGDIVFDDLSVFEPLVAQMGHAGFPWFYVIGNHDENYDADGDPHADESFERVFGPSYSSFDYGPVHFIRLDDIMWHPRTEERNAHYTSGLGEEQLAFVRNDLALVPEDQLVVLLMHIPINEMAERQELFRLLEGRPHTLSFSAHTHSMEHRFFGEADGWHGKEPHHHVVNGTACGCWWGGAPDDAGIPHATMADGTPNGYSLVTFSGADYSIEYRVFDRSPDYQFRVMAPEEVTQADVGSTPIRVNVFAGSERTEVEMRVGTTGPWTPLERVSKPDPSYVALRERDRSVAAPYRGLPKPDDCTHLWEGWLPTGLPAGDHSLYIRVTDMFGRVQAQRQTLRVR